MRRSSETQRLTETRTTISLYNIDCFVSEMPWAHRHVDYSASRAYVCSSTSVKWFGWTSLKAVIHCLKASKYHLCRLSLISMRTSILRIPPYWDSIQHAKSHPLWFVEVWRPEGMAKQFCTNVVQIPMFTENSSSRANNSNLCNYFAFGEKGRRKNQSKYQPARLLETTVWLRSRIRLIGFEFHLLCG